MHGLKSGASTEAWSSQYLVILGHLIATATSGWQPRARREMGSSLLIGSEHSPFGLEDHGSTKHLLHESLRERI